MEKLLGVEEVASLLGISRFTIYCWAKKRRLPAVKVGSRLMFRPGELQEWIEGRPRPAASQAERTAGGLGQTTAVAQSGVVGGEPWDVGRG